MFASLNVVRGKEPGREYKLGEEETLLGRGHECGIVIDDVAASRRHARIAIHEGRYTIEDLKSTNRTFVNGLAVSGRQWLENNDAIRIGETQFVFRIVAPALAVSEDDDFSTVLNSQDLSPGSDVMFQGNAQAKLRAILQITQAMGQTLDLDVLLDTMLAGLFQIFPQASRALVLLRDGDMLTPRAVKYRENDEGSVQYSRTIVTRVLHQRQAILSQDAAHDERFASTQSIVNLQIRSVMCVPMMPHESEPLGVVQLETQQIGARFNAADMQILASVAIQVAVFIQYARLHDDILRQSRLQRELELAELVQQDFLPQTTPELDEYRFWAYYHAAGRVGGDYYDFPTLPNGRYAVLLGDVSGKGVPAALRMAKASTACKLALLSYPDDVAQAMAAMNREICRNASRGGFITLALCVIDPQAHQCIVANAGHPSPLLRRPDGTMVELAGPKRAGLPLGVIETQEYPARSVSLEPGDVIVLFSDGISEAANTANRLYSARRVRKIVAAEKDRSPAETGEALIADVRRFAGEREQSDDISLVVFGRSPGDAW